MLTSPARDNNFPGIAVENCIGSALNIGGPARRGRGAYVRRMGVHTRQNAREKKKGAESNSETARLSHAGESTRASWQARARCAGPQALAHRSSWDANGCLKGSVWDGGLRLRLEVRGEWLRQKRDCIAARRRLIFCHGQCRCVQNP